MPCGKLLRKLCSVCPPPLGTTGPEGSPVFWVGFFHVSSRTSQQVTSALLIITILKEETREGQRMKPPAQVWASTSLFSEPQGCRSPQSLPYPACHALPLRSGSRTAVPSFAGMNAPCWLPALPHCSSLMARRRPLSSLWPPDLPP